eukprot:CAMPEP_0177595108 /NCGR_PEP_ID=MMETSP0419_2-20121207/10165_1 /TAXON_ID=582737 /ORGANISM="Tetraselmis sp., Strain GSL018" /LENGTH=30 /DNA_ID= /DNA_START= /DNA_END= /DNA_ORIENTATION=
MKMRKQKSASVASGKHAQAESLRDLEGECR